MDKIKVTGSIQQISAKPAKISKAKAKTESIPVKGDSVSISKVPSKRVDVDKKVQEVKAENLKAETFEQSNHEIKTESKPRFASSILDLSVDPTEEKAMMEKACNVKEGINPRNAQVIDKALGVLKNNRQEINGHTFTTPSKVVDETVDYEGKQWLWDSCFHAMVLSDTEPGVAKEELRSVIANRHPDGFIPHMNYFRGDAKNLPEKDQKIFKDFLKTPEGADVPADKRTEFYSTFWSFDDHSDITQPPIVGMAVEKVFNATGDREFAAEMIPALKDYYNYLHDKRDPDGDNLVSIVHPWESGWDHSQRWDDTIGVTQGDKPHIASKKMNVFCNHKKVGWDLDKVFEMDKFNVEPVDFNVLYALNMQSLSRLCEATGDKAGAKLYKKRAEETSQAIFDKMWDGDKYIDLCGKDEKRSQVKSAAMFYPMMLDGETHGKELVEKHLMNPKEFNTKYPIPTTSIDHPLSRPDEYWRGNVWQNVNYFCWQGLEKLLEKDPDYKPARMMADRIKNSSYELLDKFGFYEYFNPHTGDGHGAKTFGWNGIIRFMEPDYKPES